MEMIKQLRSGRYYGSWSSSNDENCEYPAVMAYGSTEKEARDELIKALELVISEAQDAIQELNDENN